LSEIWHSGVESARRHLVLLPVLVAGLALRWYVLHTYPYAFFFPDSRPYVAAADDGRPNPVRPYGYSLLLKPFADGPHVGVAVAQHLAGLVLLVVAYAFLTHRGVRPWVAALAVLPLALDARMVTLEHYVLAETAYVVCTAAGLFVLAWRDRLGWVPAAVGGLLLGFAAITRTVGLPVLALVGVYLIVRRAGRLRLAAFALPVLAVLGGYLAWYHQSTGVYAFGQYQGRFLYARVMPIADCDRLRLTAEQRTLCLPDPPAEWAGRPDQYIWNPLSPARRLYPTVADDPFLGDFASTVIRQEPGRYLAMVATETSWHLRLRAPVHGLAECLTEQWIPPESPGSSRCVARYYLPTATPADVPSPSVVPATADMRRLHAYGEVVTTPGPLYAIGVIAALIAIVRRPGRRSLDALLFTLTGFGLLVISVATSLFDYRYAVPAVLLIPLGLALALSPRKIPTPFEYAVKPPIESSEPCPPTTPTSKSASSYPA
jgi:hypothetical protein